MFYSLLLIEVDEYMKEQQAALEAEKEKILNDKSLISADKQKLLDDMKAKENALKDRPHERAGKKAPGASGRSGRRKASRD